MKTRMGEGYSPNRAEGRKHKVKHCWQVVGWERRFLAFNVVCLINSTSDIGVGFKVVKQLSKIVISYCVT